MDYLAKASRLVSTHLPEVSMAFLTGSAARGNATSTSDLDIVAILPGQPAPFRQTLTFEGQLAELFVHTPASVREFVTKEVAARNPTLAHMFGYSLVVVGGPDADELQQWAKGIVDAGPAPLAPDENEYRRYTVSALVDDLADASGDEAACVAGSLFVATAELFLAHERRWFGQGKWLARRLRDADPDVSDRLLSGYRSAVNGSAAALMSASREVLDRSGGFVQDGLYRRAPVPEAGANEAAKNVTVER